MSAAKHTPGPWFYRKGDEWSHSVVTHHGELPDGSINCWTVASINKRREPEHEANARLIAAAPDLLVALQRLEARIAYYAALGEGEAPNIEQWAYTDGSGDVAVARAAIAKATGAPQ